MSDIPEDILCINEKPFIDIGVAYLDPYQIKLSKTTRPNQDTIERCVALFACFTTRKVHLEIAGDLSADAFNLH